MKRSNIKRSVTVMVFATAILLMVSTDAEAETGKMDLEAAKTRWTMTECVEKDADGRFVNVFMVTDTSEGKVGGRIVATLSAEEDAVLEKWLSDVVLFSKYDDLELKLYVLIAQRIIALAERDGLDGAVTKRVVNRVISHIQERYVEGYAGYFGERPSYPLLGVLCLTAHDEFINNLYGLYKNADHAERYRGGKLDGWPTPEKFPKERVAVSLGWFWSNDRRTVTCRVNGRKCKMLVDTGAPYSRLSRAFYNKHFAGTPSKKDENGKKDKGDWFFSDSFKVGDADFGKVKFGFLSASQFGNSFDGVLGKNILIVQPTLLSVGGRKLIFNPDGRDCAGFCKPVSVCDGYIYQSRVIATCLGRHFAALIDSGATDSNVDVSVNWPHDSREIISRSHTAKGTTDKTCFFGNEGTLSIGGQEIPFCPIVLKSPDRWLPCRILLGADTLKSCDLLFDGDTIAFRPR